MRMRDAMAALHEELRYEPIEQRVRADLGGKTVVDSTRALLVWEPRRVVPVYAVPLEDLRAELTPAQAAPDDGAPVLHPGIPFAVHSSAGEAVTVTAGGERRAAAGFRSADPDLAGHITLDFNAFDRWREEEDPVEGHPRSPFHRIDVRRSSRRVQVEVDGEILADSTGVRLLYETSLPTRTYFPADDVVPMQRSTRRSFCPYKGRASYWAPAAGGRVRDGLAWTYEQPFPEAVAITGLVAFFDEAVDVIVDGERRPRPDGPIAAAMAAEFGVER